MQLKDIKRMYRLYMNGIVSQSMRDKGVQYRVNFGLTLPLLRRIAAQVPPSPHIAQELWQDTGVRESMLLAPMLYPADQFTPEMAQQWIMQMPNTEVADFCCKYLFAQLPYAPQLVTAWIAGETDVVVYTGYRLAYSLLDTAPSTQWVSHVAGCAVEAMVCNRPIIAAAARRFLTESLIHPDCGAVVTDVLHHTASLDPDIKSRLIALHQS